MSTFTTAICIYPFSAEPDIDPVSMERALAAQPFAPCGSIDMSRHGFEEVIERDRAFLFEGAGHLSCRFVTEEKRLPAGYIRDNLAEHCAEFAKTHGREPGRLERKELREIIKHELIPKLIPIRRRLMAHIDTERDWIIVDTACTRQAETMISAMRQALGSLPVTTLRTHYDWSSAMTRWLESGDLPDGYELDSDCVLMSRAEDGGSANLRKHDLTVDEVKHHIAAGKVVTRLGLIWRDRMRFVLDAKGMLRNIKPTDLLMEPLDALDEVDATARSIAALNLRNLTMRALLDELLAALGGVVTGSASSATSEEVAA